jgi:ParB family chromosome partitioning protein
MYGILQPLTVTRKEIQREDGTFYTEYELIAGERRLRASKLAGLSQVPVIIREGDDSEQEKLELAIIENLQREDLNAVDRALAFRQLADVFGLSHTQVAKKVGRSREYVSNSIRLLALPDYMLNALKKREMTEGHARTLLMLNDRPEEQDVVFREILLKKLSVREVERIVRKIATDKVRKKHPGEFDSELIEIEKKFMETLGTRVQIQKTDYGGRLTIDYFSVEDLEVILERMKQEQASAPTLAEAAVASAVVLSEHTALDVALDDTGKDSFDQSSEDFMTLNETEVIETQTLPASESVLIPNMNPDPSQVKDFIRASEPELQPEPEIKTVSQGNYNYAEPEASLVVPPEHVLMKREENLPAIAPAYSLLTRTENNPFRETQAATVETEIKPQVAASTDYFNRPKTSEYIPQTQAPVGYSYIPQPQNNIPASAPTPMMPVPPPTPAPIPPVKEDDDSGMYSIRNFSV